MEMNMAQWSTEDEAKAMLVLVGPLGGGGTYYVPEYAGPFSVDPGPGSSTLFWHLKLFNGFECNVGLNVRNVEKYGEVQAKAMAKAEMQAAGRWVINS
jgi:hypothetical protein